MNRKLNRVERLVRLRKQRQRVAQQELHKALEAAAAADTLRASRRDEEARSQEDQQRLLADSPPALWLRAASGAVQGARHRFDEACDALNDARLVVSAQRAVVEQTTRRLNGAERARDRILDAVRRKRERSEAKRLDDAGARRRGAFKLSVVATLMLAMGAPVGHAEDEAPKRTALTVSDSLAAIRTRQYELDRRERELADRERTVEALEEAVVAKLDELEKLSERVSERIASWEEAEGGKSIGRLSRIYAAMPPENASALLAKLDVELATQIVAKMKPKQSSAVLAQIDREKARRMSELIAHPLSMEPAKVQEDGR